MSYISKVLAEQFLRFSYESNTVYFLNRIEQDTLQNKDKYLQAELAKLFTSAFTVSWSLGGTSCGYSGETYIVDGEREPDMDHFDNFLLAYYPNMGFLHYKKIIQKMDITQSSDSDYYGGSTNHMTKNLRLEDLDRCLIEFKFLSPTEETIDLTPDSLLELYKNTIQADILTSLANQKSATKKNQGVKRAKKKY